MVIKKIPRLHTRFFLLIPVILLSHGLSPGQELKFFPNGQPTLMGSDAPYFIDTPARHKIDLSGTWSCTADEETWREVKIPSAMNGEGKVTFVRKFKVGDKQLVDAALKLVSLGINYEAEISINDIFVGKHTGAYTSFAYDIPDNIVQPGEENVLKIVVSNVLSARGTLPVRKQIWGWRNYGGITRDIFILATPRLWLESLQARADLSDDFKRGSVTVHATISNRSYPGLGADSVKPKTAPTYQIGFELVEKLSGTIVAQTVPFQIQPEDGKDTEVSLSFSLTSVKPWSPETPDLYILKATVFAAAGKTRTPIDEFDTEIGFRTIQLQDGGFLINGKRLSLRGVCWVEDSPDHGSSLTYEQMEKDIALIKTLGANAIRFSFHPPHPYLLSLCSRYGLMALVELPVWNVPGEVLGDESFQALAESMAREMVHRDRNNPAVAAWGIGDEFDSSDRRAKGFVARIVKAIKAADERPIYYGSKMLASDVCSDLVDISAVSLPAEDVKEFKTKLIDWKKKQGNRPVLLLRYGKTVESGNRNGYSDPMSEEAQARFFLLTYTAQREAGIAGSFIEAFADWRGDRPVMTVDSKDHYVHPVGLISEAREKRLAYEVVKTLFAGQKVTALPIGKHRSTFPVVHVVSGFVIIFVVAYQYHYNRRFGEAFKRSLLRSYNFFADLRDVRTVSIFHTLLLTVLISLTLAVVLSSLLYHFRTDVFADAIITQLVVSDVAKEYLIRAAWHPLEGIGMLTGVFLLISFLVSILVRLSSVFVKSKIHWVHAYTVTVWAAVPFLFLSPLGMSLFKILQAPFYVLPSFLVLFIFMVWVVLRTLKGISVIFDMSSVKAYIGGGLATAALIALFVFYYDSEFSLTAYLEFLYNLSRSA